VGAVVVGYTNALNDAAAVLGSLAAVVTLPPTKSQWLNTYVGCNQSISCSK